MAMVVRMREKLMGCHVHCTFFMGEDGQTLANCGKLCFRIGEWQLFGAALQMGVQQTKGRLRLMGPDLKDIERQLEERSHKEEADDGG